MSSLYEIVACQSYTTGKIFQGVILDRNVVEDSSKRHYFICKESVPTICHNIRVPIKKIKAVLPLRLFLNGKKHFNLS